MKKIFKKDIGSSNYLEGYPINPSFWGLNKQGGSENGEEITDIFCVGGHWPYTLYWKLTKYLLNESINPCDLHSAKFPRSNLPAGEAKWDVSKGTKEEAALSKAGEPTHFLI